MQRDTIEGFYYIPEYLSKEEEKELIAELQVCSSWRPVGTGAFSRRVIQYGYKYGYNGSELIRITPVPQRFLSLLDADRLRASLPTDAAETHFEQLIINEYKPGQGIANHIDDPDLFGPVILCLSLGSGIELEFTELGNPSNVTVVFVKPRSCYLLTGKARYQFLHGIRKRKTDMLKSVPRTLRYSLTFRPVRK